MVELKKEIRYDFLWERRPFHRKYLNLFDTCEVFSKYYNKQRSKNLNRNKNIVKFYLEIAKASGIKKQKLGPLKSFLKTVTKELSDWDILVREQKLNPKRSRKLIWTSEGLSLEEEMLLTEKTDFDYNLVKRLITEGLTRKESEKIKEKLHLDDKVFVRLKKKTLNTVRKEFKLVRRLGMNFKRYIEVAEADLCDIEDYYGWKKKSTSRNKIKELELEIINKGKGHFHFYNHILYHLILKDKIKGDVKLIHYLDNFLRHYLDLLFICHEFLDIKADIKDKTFNLLIWLNKCVDKKTRITTSNYHKQFIKNRVYDLLLSIVDDSAQKAAISLLEIHEVNHKLYDLLEVYFDGIVEGLDIFLRHEYISRYPEKRAHEIKELILNPHPWETTSFNKTFPRDLEVKKKAIKSISQVRDLLKEETKFKDPKYCPGQYNSIASASTRLMNMHTHRCIIPLRSRGCSYAFLRGGPCNICGIRGDNLWKRSITPKQIVDQFERDFSRVNFKKHDILGVYCNGSFLDKVELDPRARDSILKIIAKEKGIHQVDIEARPEYVSYNGVKHVKKLLGKKMLEISTGFDAIDEDVRNLIVNKGMTREELEAAAKVFVRSHVDSLVYVGVKAPFLTEKEGIQEAIDTIEYLFRIGIEGVSLEPVTVQDYTLTAYLYDRKLFRPAWLWSIIEILKATHTKINVPMIGPEVVGGFVFFPLPNVVAHNCPKCDKKVVKAIKKFSDTQDIRIFDKLNCSCKKKWQKALDEDALPLYERIVDILQKAKKVKVKKK